MSQPPNPTDPPNPFDPFGLWKQSQQTMLDSWSKAMTDAVNTDAYAEATGRMLDSYLTVAAPIRKVIEQTMTQLLNQLSLPSRGEVVSLAERLTNIELRLDDLDARLDGIQRGVERTASAVAVLSVLATTAQTATAGAGAPNGTGTRVRTSARRRGSATDEAKTPTTSRTASTTRSARGAARGATTAAQPRPRTRRTANSETK